MRLKRKEDKMLDGKTRSGERMGVRTIVLSELAKRKGRTAARVDFISGNRGLELVVDCMFLKTAV